MFSHHINRQRMEPGSGLCFCTLTITPSGGTTCKIISNCKIVQYHAIDFITNQGQSTLEIGCALCTKQEIKPKWKQ